MTEGRNAFMISETTKCLNLKEFSFYIIVLLNSIIIFMFTNILKFLFHIFDVHRILHYLFT